LFFLSTKTQRVKNIPQLLINHQKAKKKHYFSPKLGYTIINHMRENGAKQKTNIVGGRWKEGKLNVISAFGSC
jgi:hypothetical protein